MPKPDDSHSILTLDPGRHRLIRERLHGGFYNEPEPSEQIATAVLADLRDLDKGRILSH